VFADANGQLALSARVRAENEELDQIIDSVLRVLAANGSITVWLEASGDAINLDIDGDLVLAREGDLSVTKYDLHYRLGPE